MKLKAYLEKEIKLSKEYENMTFPEDVQRIVDLMSLRDIEITPSEAEDIWELYSGAYCAQWLGLPDDDERIFDIIIEYGKRKYGLEEDDE